MDNEIITFGETEVGKHKFHPYKSPILLEDGNIDNIMYLARFLVVKKTLNAL